MIGKEIGDEVTVKAPGGIREFQIVDIRVEEII
jgi:transcription elongation GreA/GreB family factor